MYFRSKNIITVINIVICKNLQVSNLTYIIIIYYYVCAFFVSIINIQR